ncbi:hypothetical protein VB711_07735 [Cronbergia sp. UHCC 0137]|uniref:hypothetical protein n=1 Tax=Cronbergia sp. UHCC 0137 TaxID=3110239 RepID=UPI002B1F2DB0|nr:hypothetical protein [Cronbergia sp. UHCC 0137]MEA5617727.1 hypothetical protein [Cronbergia sp. UHCC 0137]
MPKPTTILALDPHSAALCATIKQQLQYHSIEQSQVFQAYLLTWDGLNFGFRSDLEQMTDQNFDLTKTRSHQASISQIRSQFINATNQIQPLLIELLKNADQSLEAIAAKQTGVEIANLHRVYLMLSVSDRFSRGVIFQLTRLIRWLFTKFFADVPHSLEALLLLPGLFNQTTTADYAAAYGFLKELDWTMTNGVVISGTQKGLPFDNCWLIDDRIGELKDNLISYADAFSGFLTVEPEINGLLIGINKVRGKIPAYSAFGYGELFFPVETAVSRLSNALAANIMVTQFLPRAESTPESNRKWLLDAKEFVLSEDYSNAFLLLERDKGRPVWQDFNPRLEMRAGMVQEYIMELQRAYQQFENKELLSYKRSLESCCKQAQSALVAFLDRTINRYADAAPRGLHEAIRLLNVLTYSYLELQTESISEQPQNLVTELRITEAFLDSRLEIKIDQENTQNLLNQVLSLKLRRQQLHDSLGQFSSEEIALEIETTQEQLETAIAEYRQALNIEVDQARKIRLIAIARAREKAQETIIIVQKHLTSIENQIHTATDHLNELLEEESFFRYQYLFIYPLVVVVVCVILLILTGLFSQSSLWSLLQEFWRNLGTYLLWTISATFIYLGLVWLKYSTNIRDRIQQVQKQIKRLESSLKASAVELRHSYNQQLKLDYDLYLQNLRIEALNHLIKTAKQRTETLRQTQSNFEQIYDDLVDKRDRATTKFSDIRLTVLTDADIDAYYQSILPKLPIKQFTQEQVSRSQSWQMSAEAFQNRLIPFARQQFEPLSDLSIGELLQQSELISTHTANLRLNQLYNNADLLLRLQDIDTNLNQTSQKELTIWVGEKDKERLFGFYSRLSRTLTALVGEDEKRLYMLTRCLGFPAYLLSQIEFYRDCYERTEREQIQEDENIPDLIPDEIGSSKELKLAYQTLLLAIALDLLSQNSQGIYQFQGNLLDSNREQIALSLANEFPYQELYRDIKDLIETFDRELIYQKLQTLETSINNLTDHERKFLDQLLIDYNPLN